LAIKAGVLTPSPSPSTRPAATIHGGAGLRIDAIMGDEDHFAIVDFDRALFKALTFNLIGTPERCQPKDDSCCELVT
jgi:hypothetical protein